MEFGEYIRKVRKDKGISARELSRRAGISQSYLSQLETGKYKNPTKKIVIDISNGLNISRVEPLRKAGYLSDEDYKEIQRLKETSTEMREELLKQTPVTINIDDLINHVLVRSIFVYENKRLSRRDSLFLISIITLLSEYLTKNEDTLTDEDIEITEKSIQQILKRGDD